MLNGLTPVHAAAVNGHTACLKILASHGCHLESCCYQGWSAVHLAAYNGHLDCLKYLHEQACNMTLKKNNGDTPLTCAAEQSQLDCVSFLQYLADDSTDTLLFNTSDVTSLASFANVDMCTRLSSRDCDTCDCSLAAEAVREFISFNELI